VLIARESSEGGLHAPDSDQGTGGHAILPLDGVEQRRVGPFHAFALRGDGRGAALLHELVEGELEAVLAAIGLDGAVGVLRGHQGADAALADAVGLGLLGEGALPLLEAGGAVAARGGQ
jgi:hypothetical protein